jgi:NhaP-type Na+/H+ or K+/H+ antiporter
MYQNLAILAAFAFVYSAVAGRLEKTPISGAIVAMGFGFASGPLGLGIFTPHVDGELLRTLAELTLALVLFTDAANANLSVLKSGSARAVLPPSSSPSSSLSITSRAGRSWR